MHISGILGMQRRIYTYAPSTGWGPYNITSTIGAFIVAISIALLLWNIVRSIRSGEPSGANPWGSYSLEWSVPSPPPAYNFATIPIVRSRYPLWDDPKLALGEATLPEEEVVLRSDRMETLVSTGLDAEPDARAVLATPALWSVRRRSR